MTRVTLPAYAKVNLFLNVLGKRPDGYHELVTLFERIDLADQVTLETIPGGRVEAVCDHPDVPVDGSNLVARAAVAYQEAAGWKQGVRIVLEKKIPVAAGLGGGSSDAAATLQGLQILSGSRLPEEKLVEIARNLGADVAFFLSRVPWAMGTGRGDQIQPVDLKAHLWHLLVYPRFPVPTKAVYQAFSLTAPGPDVKLLFDALRDSQVPRIRQFLFNALEPTVEAMYPALRSVKATIQSTGGMNRSLVSGSGSTVVAVCSSREEAVAAADALRLEKADWQVFVASTRS